MRLERLEERGEAKVRQELALEGVAHGGEPVPVARPRPSVGGRLLEWAGPLHTGGFGGWPIRLAWFVLGLAPALLFGTGFISWYSRVISPFNSTSRGEPSINTRPPRERASGTN